jgi:hypothetical protein
MFMQIRVTTGTNARMYRTQSLHGIGTKWCTVTRCLECRHRRLPGRCKSAITRVFRQALLKATPILITERDGHRAPAPEFGLRRTSPWGTKRISNLLH